MRGLTVLAAACALACAAPATAAPPAEIVPGEVVVAFAPDAAAAQRARAMAVVDADGSRALGSTGIRVVQLGDGESVGAAVRELERLPGVRYAEPNYVVRAALTPNDPLFGDGTLFGLLRIGAPAAWDVTTGSGVTVGVVDTGIAAGHEDLVANTVPGRDFVALGGADSADYASHGTHVAGTIAAAGGNALGVVGVAFGAHVQSLRALGADGSGTTADAAEAFAYAGAAGIRIVNASLGTSAPSAAIADAIALSPKTLFVVSAGNSPGGSDNDLQPTYPCSFVSANVICVAASDSLDRLATFSHYGLASVDLAAPGAGIVSTVPAFADALHEDFEGGALSAGWTVESGDWRVINGFTGGALVDSPGAGADYVRNSDARVVSPAVATPAGSECAVEYRLRLRTADEADALVVEAGPSAAGPWQQLAQLSGSIDTGAARLVSSSFPTGSSTTWHVRLRFVSGADFAVADGAEVGEVALRCVTGSAYASFDGTSMAAPHVAGAAALLLSRNPALGSTELRDALLQGTVPVPDLAGKVATGGRLDVARALAVRLLPVAKTGVSESDANAGVVMHGSVDPRGEATTFAFEYGPTAAYGSRTAEASLVPSSGAQEVTAAVSGLALGATYHVRLVARSAGGTANGDDAVFATVADLTDPITRIRLPACPKPFRKATCKRFRSRAKAWKVLAGTVSDRKPSSGIARVEVAVTADRVGKVCRGFDGHRLIRLRCGLRRFVPARLTTAGWSLRLGSLPNGRYQVRVRGRDGAKNVEGPKAGRNTFGFTIERR